MGHLQVACCVFILCRNPNDRGQILTCMLFSWLSDKYKHRSTFIYIQSLMCLAGLVLTAFGEKNGVRYFGKSSPSILF